MDFLQAMRCCPPGYYVKTRRGGWSEYFMQYGRDDEGKLYWTAGGTTGGPLTEARIPKPHSDDYDVYRWGSSEPETKLPTFAEAYERIRLNSVNNHRMRFLSNVKDVVALCTQKAIEMGVEPIQANQVVNTTVREFLDLLDQRRPGKPVFHVSYNDITSPNMAGGLVDLFDQINS